MLKNVIDSTAGITENRNDTSLFSQKPYLRTNYTESNMEEGIEL